MPGVLKGGVYSNLIRRISRLTKEGNLFSAGLDYGFKHDPMTAILVSTQSGDYETVDVLGEFYIDNQSHYSHQQLAYKIINWFKYQSMAYPPLKEGLWVYCDKSNPTFIEMLNYTAELEGLKGLSFIRSKQMEVLLRINFKQGLLSSYKLNIALNCKHLYRELRIATWDLKAAKPKLAEGSPDHMSDAFDYALTRWYSKLLSGVNPYGFSKEYRMNRILAKKK